MWEIDETTRELNPLMENCKPARRFASRSHTYTDPITVVADGQACNLLMLP